MEELQKIYDSEINISISTFWDGSFDVKLGDHMNGYYAESNVDKAEEIVPWFQKQILIHFPDSYYAKHLSSKEPRG